MNAFRNSVIKDGKPDFWVIGTKILFVIIAIIYTILFFMAKEFKIGSYLYSASGFTFFHFIMLIPAIACLVFAFLAHSEDWLTVAWQISIIMIACLVVTVGVSIFSGLKSETKDIDNYLVFDQYISETEPPEIEEDEITADTSSQAAADTQTTEGQAADDQAAQGQDAAADNTQAVDPNAQAIDPNAQTAVTEPQVRYFIDDIKDLFPAVVPDDAKSEKYYYYLNNFPILGANFDVFAQWRLDDAQFAEEVSRLSAAHPNVEVLADKNNKTLTHYIIRKEDEPKEYYYVFYSIDTDKNQITYCVSYSERSTEPYFEKQKFDLGRIGDSEEIKGPIVAPASSSELSSTVSDDTTAQSSDIADVDPAA